MIEVSTEMLKRLSEMRIPIYFTTQPCRWNREYRVPETITIWHDGYGDEVILRSASCTYEEEPGVVRYKCKFEESDATKDYEYSFDCVVMPEVIAARPGEYEYEAVYILDAPITKPAGKTLVVTWIAEARVY